LRIFFSRRYLVCECQKRQHVRTLHGWFSVLRFRTCCSHQERTHFIDGLPGLLEAAMACLCPVMLIFVFPYAEFLIIAL
jgi:hypothetical protein